MEPLSLEEEERIHRERDKAEKAQQVLLVNAPIATFPYQAPLTVTEGTPVSAAVRLMQEKHYGAVLVTDTTGCLTGIATERDFLMKLLPDCQTPLDQIMIETVMTAPAVALRCEDSIAFALNRMSVDGLRHIPLVDEHQHPVGILSIRNIIKRISEDMAPEIVNLPPRPQNYSSRHGG